MRTEERRGNNAESTILNCGKHFIKRDLERIGRNKDVLKFDVEKDGGIFFLQKKIYNENYPFKFETRITGILTVSS